MYDDNFTLLRDESSIVNYGLALSGVGENATVPITGLSVTVPAGYNQCLFSYEAGASCLVSFDAITAPGATFAATKTRINPTIISVKAGSQIYILPKVECWVNIEYFKA